MSVWKSIKGFERTYEVSDSGEVRRLGSSKSLKPLDNGKGYKQVSLSQDNIQYKRYIHRLVAEAFLDSKCEEVNHKDGDKSNNKLSNLEWVTELENKYHSARVLKRRCKKFIVTAPDGNELKINGLVHFCQDNDLDQGSMTRVAQGKQRKHKGWMCRYD